MNKPKNQQEMPLVEETFLDQVTGSGSGQSTGQPSEGKLRKVLTKFMDCVSCNVEMTSPRASGAHPEVQAL